MEINDLLDKVASLRSESLVTLTLTSPELVEMKSVELDEQRNKILEADSSLADQMDVLRGKRRALQLADEYLGTDIKKLKNYFWKLRNAEKDATRYPRQQ
jgi:hypothetical protein